MKQNTSKQYGGHEDKLATTTRNSVDPIFLKQHKLRFTIRNGPLLTRQPIVRQRMESTTTTLEWENINIFKIADLLSHICLNVRA